MAPFVNPLADLESNDLTKVEDCKSSLKDQFTRTKDPWLLNGVYDYYLNTNSLRAVDVMVVVQEPHDKYFFDKALDGIKGPEKLKHLTLLGHVVRKKPIWLYKIFQHTVIMELLRLLKNETDIVIVVSALLILNILIPSIPSKVGPILQDIFGVFSKLAAMNANSNNYQNVQLVHLQISLYTLFHRLYGMFPCNFVTFLRKEYSTTTEKYSVFSHTVKPMLETVRLNSWLITVNEKWEIEPQRWKNVESHDIIAYCAKLLMNGGTQTQENYYQNIYEPKSSFDCKNLLSALKVTSKQTVSDYCKQLSKTTEDDATLWSPSARHHERVPVDSNPTSIPLTPIARGFEVSSPYSEHEGASPPEAAVEATPETTPIRDIITTQPPLFSMASRSLLSFKESTIHGSKVPGDRPFGNSLLKELSPLRSDTVQIPQSTRKVNALLTDRRQANPDGSIELKQIGVQHNTNDLIGTERTNSVISFGTSLFVDGVSESDKTRTNESICEAADEFDLCEPEKSGSPCSSGGLHMPDQRSLSNFRRQFANIRIRHYSQCNSDSEHLSPEQSPRDRTSYLKNLRIRKIQSCPEISKLDRLDEERTSVKNTKKTSATQTDDVPVPVPHFPYEHLFLDVFPPLHPSADQNSPAESENSLEERSSSVYEKAHSPSKLLQKYIDAAIQCHNDKIKSRDNLNKSTILVENKFLTNQLKLMGVQLQLEEHKREIHAERNRRMLGRCRRNKTLEEHNNALQDQVHLLQQEILRHQRELEKIIAQKEADLECEQKKATYWQEQFVGLQHGHKIIANRCQKVEAQLKEEKDLNEQKEKSLHETRAELNDITNDLRSYQKEAIEAKNLREIVLELQAEVLKAGELIINYQRRLFEINPSVDQAQYEIMRQACSQDVKKLDEIVKTQRLSLESTQTVVSTLRKDLQDKENCIRNLKETLQRAKQVQEDDIKELKQRIEELKTLYENEKTRANDLNWKLDHARQVTKLSNVGKPRNIDHCSKLREIFVDDKSIQNMPKSPKKTSFAHLDKQQIDLFRRTLPPIENIEKDEQLFLPSGSEPAREPETKVEAFKPIVKKKNRMECAESGQLKPLSFTLLDPEPSSSKNE